MTVTEGDEWEGATVEAVAREHMSFAMAAIEIFLRRTRRPTIDGPTERQIATTLAWVDVQEVAGQITRAPVQLSREAAQALMDDLWRIGIRPKEQGSPGQLAAMSAHLADMRTLALDKLLPFVMGFAQARVAPSVVIKPDDGSFDPHGILKGPR